MNHHYHLVEMKDVGPVKLPSLNGKLLEDKEHIEVIFPDYTKHKGHVLIDNSCCIDKHLPFMPICYHGTKPWVYLVGMKAARIKCP